MGRGGKSIKDENMGVSTLRMFLLKRLSSENPQLQSERISHRHCEAVRSSLLQQIKRLSNHSTLKQQF